MRFQRILAPASRRAEFGALRDLVGAHNDLQLDEWYALHDLATGFKPDLIVELGRGYGNSTIVLSDAAHRVGGRVVSVGNDWPPAWENETRPKLDSRLRGRWFKPLTTLQGQIEETDLTPWTRRARRTLVFWDAHGRDVAEYIVATLLPSLPSPSLTIVHDMHPATERLRLEHEYEEVVEYADVVSPYAELPVIGNYLNSRKLSYEQAHSLIWFEL